MHTVAWLLSRQQERRNSDVPCRPGTTTLEPEGDHYETDDDNNNDGPTTSTETVQTTFTPETVYTTVTEPKQKGDPSGVETRTTTVYPSFVVCLTDVRVFSDML